MPPTCGVSPIRNTAALAVSINILKTLDRLWEAKVINELPSYGIPIGLCI